MEQHSELVNRLIRDFVPAHDVPTTRGTAP